MSNDFVRVQMYRGGILYVDVSNEDLAVWNREPIGRVRQLPAIPSLTDGTTVDLFTTFLLHDGGGTGAITVKRHHTFAYSIDVGPVDDFIDGFLLNESGATLRSIDDAGVISGPVETIFMGSIPGKEHSNEDWGLVSGGGLVRVIPG